MHLVDLSYDHLCSDDDLSPFAVFTVVLQASALPLSEKMLDLNQDLCLLHHISCSQQAAVEPS